MSQISSCMKTMKKLINLIWLVISLLNFSAFAADFSSAAIVESHNKWRDEVGVKEKLGYSSELAASAQDWANQLKKDNQCKMQHSSAKGYGENLYWASAVKWSDGRKEIQKVTPKRVVDSWGNEKADYDYASNRCKPGKMCGHYTQVVWKDTRKVGCAVAVCEDTLQQVWVCHYQPAGNWVGSKPY